MNGGSWKRRNFTGAASTYPLAPPRPPCCNHPFFVDLHVSEFGVLDVHLTTILCRGKHLPSPRCYSHQCTRHPWRANSGGYTHPCPPRVVSSTSAIITHSIVRSTAVASISCGDALTTSGCMFGAINARSSLLLSLSP